MAAGGPREDGADRVRVTRTTSAQEFLHNAADFLRSGQEFLPLGLAATVAEAATTLYPDAEFFTVYREEGTGGKPVEVETSAEKPPEAAAGDANCCIVLVAFRTTAEFKLVVSRCVPPAEEQDTDKWAKLAADAIAAVCDNPLGVLAPVAEGGGAFANRLGQVLTDKKSGENGGENHFLKEPRLGMAERGLVAVRDDLKPPKRGFPAGRARNVRTEDLALVTKWLEAFQVEVHTDVAQRAGHAARAKRLVEETPENLFLWVDAVAAGEEEIVLGMCALGGSRLPGALRVCMVYTPAEHRRKGVAGALVYHVSAGVLRGGGGEADGRADGVRADGVLQAEQPYLGIGTDAANPTSNKVYEELGFRFVRDLQNYWFSSALPA